MTEEQAIERIANAMVDHGLVEVMNVNGIDGVARAVWNEMKAIAREDTTTLRFYTGKAVNGSDGKELIL